MLLLVIVLLLEASNWLDPQSGVRFAANVHDHHPSRDEGDPNHLAGAQELSVGQGSYQH